MYVLPSLSSLYPIIITIITLLHILLVQRLFCAVTVLAGKLQSWLNPSACILVPMDEQLKMAGRKQNYVTVSKHHMATLHFPQLVHFPTLQDYFSNLFSNLQLPFPLNHPDAFSSHFTNKVRESRIDIPHLFTTKIYKTICIYTDTLYFSSIIIDESSTL